MNLFKRLFDNSKICPHYAPHEPAHHLLTKYIICISCFLFPFPDDIPKYHLGRLRGIWESCASWCADVLTRALLFFGIVKAEPVKNFQDILKPHTCLIANECSKRRLPLFIISIFGKPTPRFFIVANGKRLFFDELPIPKGREKHPFVDKAYVREVLLKYSIPVARGALINSFHRACEYLHTQYEFPLVYC